VNGTGALVRLALHRDRIMIPSWVLSLGMMVASVSSSISALYRTPAERAEFAAGMAGNSSLRALYGPVFDAGLGGLTVWRTTAFGATLTGLMALLLVIRHTREEEESGRLELLGAGAIDRRAPLAAGLITGCVASLAVGLLSALILLSQGTAGALAFGFSLGATGCVYAAVAAVAAQFTESARSANGIAGAVLGLSFLLRAAGDAGSGTVAWLSPLGWAEDVRPYGDERWWVFVLFAALTAALLRAAFVLVEQRDLDASLLPGRPGRSEAGPWLRNAYGLAWRLQRGALWGWASSFVIAGLALGGITQGAAAVVGENKQVAETFRDASGGAGLIDSFLATMIGLLGMVAAVYCVQAVLRLRGEEFSGRAELVLATVVGRLRWAAGHLLVALAGSVLLMLAAGLALGLGYGATTGDVGGQLSRMAEAGLVQLPAVWLVAAFAVLLYGQAPKFAAAGWGLLAVSIAIGLYGPLLKLNGWVTGLSAFTHLPKVPSAQVSAAPLVWLVLLAAALTAAGLSGLRRRDMG